jgi:hypothetical protein
MKPSDLSRSVFILLGIFAVYLVILYFTIHRHVPEIPNVPPSKEYKLAMEYQIDITNGFSGDVSVDLTNNGNNVSNIRVLLETSEFIIPEPQNITANISSGDTKTFFFKIIPGIENGVFTIKQGYMDDEIKIMVRSPEGDILLKGERKIAVCEDINKTLDCNPKPLKTSYRTEITETYANVFLSFKNIFKKKELKNIKVKIISSENFTVTPTTITMNMAPLQVRNQTLLLTPDENYVFSKNASANSNLILNITYENTSYELEIPIAVCRNEGGNITC